MTYNSNEHTGALLFLIAFTFDYHQPNLRAHELVVEDSRKRDTTEKPNEDGEKDKGEYKQVRDRTAVFRNASQRIRGDFFTTIAVGSGSGSGSGSSSGSGSGSGWSGSSGSGASNSGSWDGKLSRTNAPFYGLFLTSYV